MRKLITFCFLTQKAANNSSHIKFSMEMWCFLLAYTLMITISSRVNNYMPANALMIGAEHAQQGWLSAMHMGGATSGVIARCSGDSPPFIITFQCNNAHCYTNKSVKPPVYNCHVQRKRLQSFCQTSNRITTNFRSAAGQEKASRDSTRTGMDT